MFVKTPMIVVNLAGRVRRQQLHGREHLVAPLTLIVPGVLHGSQGPLLYPPSEVAKNPASWNHIPITVNHPTNRDGSPCSARAHHVLRRQGIGVVRQVRCDGKLTAEGWFDVAKTRQVDSRILTSLETGRPIELSTGLFTKNIPAPPGASYNGRPYKFIARNYRPDHVAVLPDRVGACSIRDGCGVLVNTFGNPIFRETSMFDDEEDLLLVPTINWAEFASPALTRNQQCTCGAQNAAIAPPDHAADDEDDLLIPPTMAWK